MLGWFRALMPREDKFFEMFSRHAQVAVEAAAALEALLQGGDSIEQQCRKIVALENQADLITREVLLALRKSFITPFDRSDITDLIQSMDDAVDNMQHTVKTVGLYGVTSFEPNMQQVGTAITEATRLMVEAVSLLSRVGSNATRLGELTEAIVGLEGHADDLHDEGLRLLLKEHRDTRPLAFFIGREIYEDLEAVVDSIEDVANKINSIMVENL